MIKLTLIGAIALIIWRIIVTNPKEKELMSILYMTVFSTFLVLLNTFHSSQTSLYTAFIFNAINTYRIINYIIKLTTTKINKKVEDK